MHRFIPDPGDPEPSPLDLSHTAAIKRWTTQILHLPADAVVHVAETTCRDAGCPLVETTVTVLALGHTRRWRLVRPRITVTKLMLQQTLASPPAFLDSPAKVTR
jgi:hypothetical protein